MYDNNDWLTYRCTLLWENNFLTTKNKNINNSNNTKHP